MYEDQMITRQVGYLTKVLLGIALLVLEVLVALGLPEAVMGPAARHGVIAVLVLTMLIQVQLIRWLYGRADELQQLMHRQACTRSLAWMCATWHWPTSALH
jgi:hypothetical protein